MSIVFPSPEFDDAVAAVCDGSASDEQAAALHRVLRDSEPARDVYILAVELHTRLASDLDLFHEDTAEVSRQHAARGASARHVWSRAWRILAAAAAISVIVVGWWRWQRPDSAATPMMPMTATTSRAVAMLERAVEVRWSGSGDGFRIGAPLEPGWVCLESGGAQIAFYHGARVSLEGPAEIQLVSADHAVVRRGKVILEVPSQAAGFRLETPVGVVTGTGGEVGLDVGEGLGLHVFRGQASLEGLGRPVAEVLREGTAARISHTGERRRGEIDRMVFASLFGLQARSAADLALRLESWREAGERLNGDASLLTRFVFGPADDARWQLRNLARQRDGSSDATVVGCRWTQGRWPGKRAIEFQSVNDRVRLNLPGEFDALTLSAWVRVSGLDRELNSLFMSDGFEPGTIHWLIRNDGVLGMTVVGHEPGRYQIAASPPVLRMERFGMWIHLAVTIDGRARRVSHYLDGRLVGEAELRVEPPYRIGPSELGNWNTKVFPDDEPFMIRNFSGAMDEFCLFDRALTGPEIESLHRDGRPDDSGSAASLVVRSE